GFATASVAFPRPMQFFRMFTDPATSLSLEITAPGGVAESSDYAYTLTVTAVSGDAANVSIVDTLPSGVVLKDVSSGCAAGVEGTVTCDVGSLAKDASRSFTLNVTAPDSTGSISNSATASADQVSPVTTSLDT